jgi:hypothetical protein
LYDAASQLSLLTPFTAYEPGMVPVTAGKGAQRVARQ